LLLTQDISEERIARFSVGEVVIFKDPDKVPGKAQKMQKIPLSQETF